MPDQDHHYVPVRITYREAEALADECQNLELLEHRFHSVSLKEKGRRISET